jgi:DNA-binding NarL/FixJ family response regulator
VDEPIEVVIVDDHQYVRDGVEVLLRNRGFAVTGVAATAEEGERMICARKPAVAMIDLVLGSERGDEMVGRVRECSPATAVLLCTGFMSPGLLARAEASGSDGLLTKCVSADELVAAILAATRRQYVADSRISTVLRGSADASRTSPRERQILALLAQGMGAAAIGDQLFLSRETVHTHVRNAIRNLGARNRVHAVAIAAALREIELPRPWESISEAEPR